MMADNVFIANLSMLFADQCLADRFKNAAEYGFTGVEIQFPYEWDVDLLKQLLTKYDLKLHLINIPAGDLLNGGRGLSCHSDNQEAFRDACSVAIKYARALDVRVVNVLAGNVSSADKYSECLDTYVENIRYAAELFMLEGIAVSFEAINNKDMPGYLYSSFQDMLNIWTKVNHPNAGMQYDIYHMAKMDEDIVSQIAEHGEKLAHIQFADSPGRGAPGSGTLPLGQIFQAIGASVYSGPVAAEYKITGDPEVDYSWLRL